MIKPLLSVVVPTRNRQYCAENLALSLHRSLNKRFELVLHDNSDSDSLKKTIETMNDPRIVYIHTSDQLDMHANFSRAIDAATGHFVCGLGDDDGILIGDSLKLLAFAQEQGCDAVFTGRHSYQWPGLNHWLWGDQGGKLSTVPVASQQAIVELEPLRELGKVFDDGTVNGLGKMPRIYHGFVTLQLMRELRKRSGSYFPGGSPDMANAVGLSLLARRMLFNPNGFVISGHSAKSGGGTGAAGRHHGQLKNQSQLPADILQNWDVRIPQYWSGHTIYAQSAVEALKATAPNEKLTLAYHRLYAACLAYDPACYRKLTLTAMRENPGWGAWLIAQTSIMVIVYLSKRFANLLSNFWKQKLWHHTNVRFQDICGVVAHIEKVAKPWNSK
jgi:glycosyltransferase involved in cell wall biosynthesis